jgi:protein-disulfide isomerase
VTAINPIHSFTGKIARYLILEKLMKKSFLLLLMLLTVGLAGCLPQATASPTPTSTAVATNTSVPQAAPTAGLTVPDETTLLPDSGCTVVTKRPTPGPTAESIYPPVTDADHTKGPADAKVTIIEYSDFQ